MVSLPSLWMPILLSAVLVFVASSIIHMFLGYHADDYRRLPDEDAATLALRSLNIPPGDYVLPRAESSEAMRSPAYVERLRAGPIVIMTVARGEEPGMGRSLMLWFLFTLLVSLFAAYIAGRALPPGAEYLSAFRFAGTTAFAGYSLALLQHSIWYRRSWRATLLGMFDGLVFALITGGVFGWLWP